MDLEWRILHFWLKFRMKVLKPTLLNFRGKKIRPCTELYDLSFQTATIRPAYKFSESESKNFGPCTESHDLSFQTTAARPASEFSDLSFQTSGLKYDSDLKYEYSATYSVNQLQSTLSEFSVENF